MHKKTLLALTIAAFTFLNSCSKDETDEETCEQLQNGIVADNKEEVKEAIGRLIRELPSQTYSVENLNKLAALIGQQCGVSATVLCFDCIHTLPSQSEIRISYVSTGGPLQKIIDISYNANNKMVFNNVHN